jgi:hypothetical protein
VDELPISLTDQRVQLGHSVLGLFV